MNNILFVHALSPLHAGAGQGIGSIDLPITRERATNIPFVPGSSMKGVLRDKARKVFGGTETVETGGERNQGREKLEALFGPDAEHASDHAGAAVFGDAKLLLFPVRSLAGTFAYTTSPYILKRFYREAQLANLEPPTLPEAPVNLQECVVQSESSLASNSFAHQGKGDGSGSRVILEDLDLVPRNDGHILLDEWASWLAELTHAPLDKRLCLLHDDVMGFLLETATQVDAGIRLDDESKTVVDGALWYKESLPPETLLYSLVAVQRSRHPEIDVSFADLQPLWGPAQIGGKASVGQGLCQLTPGVVK